MALTVADLIARLRMDTRDFQAGGKRVEAATGGLRKIFQTATATALGFGAAMVGLRGGAAVFGAIKNSVIGLNSTLETAQLQFKVLLGSSEKAGRQVKGLFEFAAKTPFETGPIIEANRLLLIFGFNAEQSQDALRLVGDAAAVAGRGIQEVAFWFGRAVSAMQAGRPFGESAMRLQEMGLISGVARAKLEALQEGGASAQEVFQAFQAEFRKFTGAMVEMAGTWEGLTSTIRDNLQLAIATGLRPFFDLIKDLAVQLADFVQTDKFQQWVKDTATFLRENLPTAIQAALGAFNALKIAVLAVASGLLTIANAILQVNLAVFEGGKAIRDLLGIEESWGVKTEEVAAKIADLTARIEENRQTILGFSAAMSGAALSFAGPAGGAPRGGAAGTAAPGPAPSLTLPGTAGGAGPQTPAFLSAFSEGLAGAEESMDNLGQRMVELEGAGVKTFDGMTEALSSMSEGLTGAEQSFTDLDRRFVELEGGAKKFSTFWTEQLQAIKDSAAQTWSALSLGFSSALAGVIQGTATMKEFFQAALNTMLQAAIQLGLQLLAQWALQTAFKQTQDAAQVVTHTATETAMTGVTATESVARLAIGFATNKALLGMAAATVVSLQAVGLAALAVAASVVATTAGILAAIGTALAASIVGAPLAPAFFAAAVAVATAGGLAIAAGLTALEAALASAAAGIGAALAVPSLDEGGVILQDTAAIVHRGEVVAPLDRLGGMAGRGMEQKIIIEIDRREVAKVALFGLPELARVRAGLRGA